MGRITESTWETQTSEVQLQSDPCFNTRIFSSVDGIWLKVTHDYHLILKKSTRPHWFRQRLRLQVESRCTEVTFPRLYSKSKAQERLNPRSSKFPPLSQTIALYFLLAIKSQLKGYSMAAWTCSATVIQWGAQPRENPLPLWDGKKAEGNSRVLLTRWEGKQ